MNRFVDHYKILGVKATATQSELRAAYVRLAKQHHPDRGGSAQAMNLVNEAYETLKNPQLRKKFDELKTLKNQPERTSVNTEVSENVVIRFAKRRALSRLNPGIITVFGSVVLALILNFLSVSQGVIWALIAPVLYGLMMMAIGLYGMFYPQSLVANRFRSLLVKHKLNTSKKLGSLFKTASVMTVVIAILVVAGINFVDRGVTNELTAEHEASARDASLGELESLKAQYEVCVESFNKTTNQLNLLNQSLSSASARGDTAGYNDLVKEQNKMVAEYGAKRTECSGLKDKYNKQASEHNASIN